jgi:hypothetical protein
MNVLGMLEGKDFVVEKLTDQLNLASYDGTLLVIFNKFSYRSPRDESSRLNTGLKISIVKAESSELEVTLHFAGGDALVVDLSANAYAGPEAMVLSTPSGKTVVWN